MAKWEAQPSTPNLIMKGRLVLNSDGNNTTVMQLEYGRISLTCAISIQRDFLLTAILYTS